ncbi:uncharacterized protein Z520_05243 [Fonsecaea multimorphosa CBS 102226]|uniref:Uncharacterized protein n=1 Tax=Fonsecaea multimorphosa CBS 102226 TaxID=1442371 RepID=A0A0D2JZ34_9EURO|nr:uncharacterized protein Z520_05243 [Fonsecaea multimorphosa CBS 102226]KIX98782.1 hypothetical protein Z520_05243 [Fonsecaea multimorphosa CBS 102226]OAL25063.1 hypothetical protein AYO22_04940 [Fonsecaea multimorphosa]
MADASDYPDDIQFAGLVQAATAAADEQTRDPSSLGKRKRDDHVIEHIPTLDEDGVGDASDPATASSPPHLQSSASVLFREPSSKSRKHSRPPLGKVFASLELAPENFLRLQTAAKAFMLDEAHPERKEVVGPKKNAGGSDLAKLNLWNCVEEFLSVHGYGERYFAPGAGEGIPGAPQRTIFWPQDSQTIIKLMMPLMRKMVTNERQRMYAAATRKQGSAKESGEEQSPAPVDQSIMPDRKAPETSFPDQEIEVHPPIPVQQDIPSLSPHVSQPSTTFKQSVVLHVNVVSNTGGALRRVIPRFSLTPEAAPSLSALLAEVEKRYTLSARSGGAPGVQSRPIVKVWLTDGLVTVVEDGEWMVALLSAGVVDWMDGEVRVLVEI